jgi:hypothetical protein
MAAGDFVFLTTPCSTLLPNITNRRTSLSTFLAPSSCLFLRRFQFPKLYNVEWWDNIVTCIARQRTGKHLATEYTQTTIELQMLLIVARQQSTPMKSLTRNYVTRFLWVRAVAIAMQRLDKQTFNNGATVFRGVLAEGLSWRPSALQSSSR